MFMIEVFGRIGDLSLNISLDDGSSSRGHVKQQPPVKTQEMTNHTQASLSSCFLPGLTLLLQNNDPVLHLSQIYPNRS